MTPFCKSFADRGYRWLGSRQAVVFFLGAGALFRLGEYFSNRAFWWDEAHIALRFMSAPFWETLASGKYAQTMPMGLAAVSSGIIALVGPSEYGLRLIPLLCGLASLPLFYALARKVVDRETAAVSLLFFTISDFLIRYSAEFKQYGSDVTLTLVIYLMALDLGAGNASRRRWLSFGIVGVVVVWFSHPSAFVLAGCGSVLLLKSARRRDRVDFIRALGCSSAWATSFLLYYFHSLRSIAQNEILVSHYGDGFMPPPSSPGQIVEWLAKVIYQLPNHTASFTPLIGVIAMLAGAWMLWRSDSRERVLLLGAPLPFLLLASAMRSYSLRGQLLLFLAPLVILLIGAGVSGIYRLLVTRSVFLAIFASALFLISPAKHAAVDRLRQENVRPVLRYIDTHWEPNDVLYVYPAVFRSVEFFSRTHGTKYLYVRGLIHAAVPGAYEEDVRQTIEGRKRAWFLFGRVKFRGEGGDEEALTLSYLDRLGERIDAVRAGEISAYLYRFPAGSR